MECVIKTVLVTGRVKSVRGTMFEVEGVKLHVHKLDSKWIVSDVVMGGQVVDSDTKEKAITLASNMFSQKAMRYSYRWELNRYECINPDICTKEQAIAAIEKGDNHELQNS